MEYKVKIKTDVCPLCKRDVKHHAKGLCNACYHRTERHSKAVDKTKQTAK